MQIKYLPTKLIIWRYQHEKKYTILYLSTIYIDRYPNLYGSDWIHFV